MESNHHSARHRVYSAGSSPVLSVRKKRADVRIRTGTSRITTSDAAVTPRPPREAGTTGLEPANLSPDKRLLLPLSYVPLHSAGGIRTHDLELMRLAGTATPLRRDLPGWSRTSDLRRPKPAGCPTPLQAAVDRHADAGLPASASQRWMQSIPIEVIMARRSRAGLRSVNTPGGTRTRSFRIESPAS